MRTQADGDVTARQPLLRVRDLKTHFRAGDGTARAVDGVSFDIYPGETFALVGESGCGKSVTALSIIQLVPEPAGYIAGGTVEYLGRDIVRLPEMEKRTLRGSAISMIFQEPLTSLNPVLTVGTQIAEVIRRHQGASSAEARHRALEMLDLVRMPEPAQRLGEYPHQLSGGMRQRVMIAIALACRPGLLIADEPTTALDVTIQGQILGLIAELKERLGTAVLLITHDLGVVAENADRVAVMYAGRIVEEADREGLFRNPCHPYTIKLLQSLPRVEQRGGPLRTIEGRVPRATHFPAHCRFADRCPVVEDRCRQVDPQLLAVDGGGHRAACVHYEAGGAGRSGLQPRLQPPSPERLAAAAAPAPAEVLLEARGLQVWFPIRRGLLKRVTGHVRAVDGVDLTIRRGRTLALVGESGCGKTTLGRALLQLVRPTAGSVTCGGTDLARLSRAQLKPYRRRLQIVFQDPYGSLNPRLRVGDILMEGMEAHGIGADGRQRRERAAALLEQVGLEGEMVHRYPHEFSGGQRQRIGVARCLAVDPELIICDEATSALDMSVQAQIINLLERLQRELGLAYLLITHDLSVVSHMADEVAVMYLGRIVERGLRDEVFDDAKHPYTKALLQAIPRVDPGTGRKRLLLGGDVPSPVHPPKGCHFHPRCPERLEGCGAAYPPETELSASRACRCFLYGGEPGRR